MTRKTPLSNSLWGRREFIRVGSLGAVGFTLSDYLFLKAQTGTVDEGKACIMIVLDGGPSHLDTFDMKPDAPQEVRGSFKPIPTNVPGIQVCEHLPKTAKQADKFAILRSVVGKTALHNQGVYYLMTGYMPLQSVTFPAMGAVVAKELGPKRGMPPYILSSPMDHSQGPGFLGSGYAPFWIRSDPSKPDFQMSDLELPADTNWNDVNDRTWLMRKLDSLFRTRDNEGTFEARDGFFRKAEDIIRSPAVKKAFDIWEEPEKLRSRYGKTPMGQSCLLARRLVEAGARFVTVNTASSIWDTHVNNFDNLAGALLPEFDPAFAALMEDLAERGLLDTTLVVVAGEFGRTPTVNKRGGRDHWPRVFSVVVAGAGIKGGQVYGASDAIGSDPKENPIMMEDLVATIYDRLGINPAKEYHATNGRPIKLANNGTPIKAIL